MKNLLFVLIVLCSVPIIAQQSITLQNCYDLITTNYPLAKQSQLLEKQSEIDSEVIENIKLPQFSLNAQATYQSEVTQVPLPNSMVDPLNKDQYRATFSVNQLIYNGGATNASLLVKSAQLKTKQKNVEVGLYQFKKQVNQLYFSILLSQETLLLLEAKQNQLLTNLSEVKSGIKYGVLLPASDKVLEAELLKIDQQFTEVQNNRIVLIETLSSLIGQSLNIDTTFQEPLINTTLNNEIKRPELELFQFKKEEITNSETLIAKQNTPQIHGFATGGYGNPGLNMLDNSFQPFYTVGVQLNWNVFDWNTNKKQRASLAVNKEIINTETEMFRLNTNIELNRQEKEIEKVNAYINSDLKIVNLRKEVVKAADSQLKNGVITSSIYITELTNLYEDEYNLIMHEIQLQLAKANYNIIQGN